MVVNPDGVGHQIHGNVIQTLSRTLMERVGFDSQGVTSREWGGYPIAKFGDVPEIEVLLMERQDCAPMGSRRRYLGLRRSEQTPAGRQPTL